MLRHRLLTSWLRVAFCTAALLVPIAVQAQGGVGVRAGVSGDPEQFYFGGHAEIGPVAERLWFRPNLEIGVGNNLTLTTANFEFAYQVPVDLGPWRLYAGGGPALNLYRRSGNTTTNGGLNLLVGVASRQGFFTELKVGVADSPSIKFGVGYTWAR